MKRLTPPHPTIRPPHLRLKTQDSRLQTPPQPRLDCLLRLKTQDSRLQTPLNLQPATCNQQPTCNLQLATCNNPRPGGTSSSTISLENYPNANTVYTRPFHSMKSFKK